MSLIPHRLVGARVFRVLARNGHDRLLQACLGPATADEAHVAQIAAAVRLDGLDLHCVVGRHHCLPVPPQLPAMRKGVGYVISRMPVRSQCRRHHAAECKQHILGSHHARRWSGTGPSISCIKPAPATPSTPPGFRKPAR